MRLRITDDLDALLDVLPPHVRDPLRQREDNFELLEVVLDLGRLPEARYPEREVVFGGREATQEDLVKSGKSNLLLGRPGVGKATMLREVARFLADDLNKRVVVVDTSNEIAGDGDIPHPGIGSARRMQVPTPTMQHAVMIEAVENHMPGGIVSDEM